MSWTGYPQKDTMGIHQTVLRLKFVMKCFKKAELGGCGEYLCNVMLIL